jgi:ADP-heptose:LPS heptosyltransferase
MNNILVFRLSAMGDVALTVPVIKGIIEQNPDLKITLVTRKFFAPFFYGIPRVELFFPDLKGEHRGLKGLFKLYRALTKVNSYSAVIDLHSVLRTWILDTFFKLSGVPVYSINKGREEKKQLLKTKKIKFLKHSTERYLDVFNRAGIKGKISNPPCFSSPSHCTLKANDYFIKHHSDKNSIRVGIAPFAMHNQKVWGTNKIKELIQLINKNHTVDFYFFGGGTKEIELLKEFKTLGNNIHIVAGELDISEEIALISMLRFMISMDSSNMHIASLAGTKTVSIWGGTHPAFGFSALGQPTEFSLQTPASSLSCRPCSVFGNKPCIYNSPKCMDMLSPKKVFEAIERYGLFKIDS